MTTQIATQPNRMTVRWTEEDGGRFSAENGKDRLEVFPAPFKPGRFCWRHLRMSSGQFWKPKSGGIADTLESAMTDAGTALAGSPKEWKASTYVR